MRATRKVRLVDMPARYLKRAEMLEGIFWYFAGYSAVLATYLGTLGILIFLLVPLGLAAGTEEVGMVAAGGLAMVVTGAIFAACSIGGWRQAVSWRQLQFGVIVRVAVVILVPLLLMTPCLIGSMVGLQELGSEVADGTSVLLIQVIMLVSTGVLWYVFVGGIAAAIQVRRLPLHRFDAAGPEDPQLGQLLDAAPAARQTLDRRRLTQFRRRVAWSACKTAWLLIIIYFALKSLTLLASGSAELGQSSGDGSAPLAAQVVTPLGMFVMTCFLSNRLTRRFHEAWTLLTPTLAEARSQDPRRPILFLRSFRAEWNLLAAGPLSFFSRSRSEIRTMEERLTDRLWRFGPVVALGRPNQSQPPSGAAREYIDTTDDNEWRDTFRALAQESVLVVVVAAGTKGVAWELECLREMGLLSRVLILFPPWFTAKEWDTLRDRVGIDVASSVHLDSDTCRTIGCRWIGSAVTTVYEGRLSSHALEATSLLGAAEIYGESSIGAARS